MPRHQRFYAGGGGSVRGYDYQSIGPRDQFNRPNGGASLVEASLEWRQRVWGDIGAVAFVDAGSVGTGSAPDTSNLRVGAGRRAALLHADRAGAGGCGAAAGASSGINSAFGLYVGIGQAF